MPIIIFLAIVIGPALVLSFLKVNSVFVYLSLCLGAVTSQFVANDYQFNKLVNSSSALSQYVGGNNIKLGLLLIPPIITAIFMVKTVKGGKFSPNIIPSIAVGILAAFLVVPLLPDSTSNSITSNSAWVQLNKYQGVIVAISSLIVLVLLILHRSKVHASGGHHKRGKE